MRNYMRSAVRAEGPNPGQKGPRVQYVMVITSIWRGSKLKGVGERNITRYLFLLSRCARWHVMELHLKS